MTMLEELKELNYNGGKEELLFFICNVIGHNSIKTRDAEVICAHAPGRRFLSVRDLINYCLIFGWVQIDNDKLFLPPGIANITNDKDLLNVKMITSTVDLLFTKEVFNSSLFSYDAVEGLYTFKNELLPLSFSTIRNVLISQGFLVTR